MGTNTYLYRAYPNQKSGGPDMAASAIRKRQSDPSQVRLIGSARSYGARVGCVGSTYIYTRDAPGVGNKANWAAQASEKKGDMVLSWSKDKEQEVRLERRIATRAEAFTYLRTV
jgi:hypothetical protein